MDVKVPNLGEGADSGVVVGILVKTNDLIKQGQTLLEIENEKAIAPIPSPVNGRVTQVFVQEGQEVSVGARLLAVDESGGVAEANKGTAPDVPKSVTGKTAKSAHGPVQSVAPTNDPPRNLAPSPTVPTRADEEFAKPSSDSAPAASPSIRKMARELGIDLARVRGTERGGRIVMKDLRAHIERLQQIVFAPQSKAAESEPRAAAPVSPSPDFSQWGPISRQPMSTLRQTISRRMLESWNTIPQVNQFDDADVTHLNELRKKHASAYEAKGVKLTLTPFVLKAVVTALRQSPMFNASLDEAANEIVLKAYYHLGLAVDTEAGLIVPVIRDVDKKSLFELARELQDLAERTRSRKIAAEELKGGTFTISNQGTIGGAHFTPLINKPEVAILGVGRSTIKPVVRENKIVPRALMPLCVSYDHRLIDGGHAARFMVQLVNALEDFGEASVKI